MWHWLLTVLVLLCWSRNGMGLKVCIVGGGPAGLLTAIALKKRALYENFPRKITSIHVIDNLDDPRISNFGQRSYSLGLNIRGQTAIKSIDEGLWKRIEEQGIYCDNFVLHIQGFSLPLRQSSGTDLVNPEGKIPPSLLIPRNVLCGVMLDTLLTMRAEDPEVRVYFNANLSEVDLTTKDLKFYSSNKDAVLSFARQVTSTQSLQPTQLSFDLLVGCDGLNSKIRNTIQQADEKFMQRVDVLDSYFKVIRLRSAIKLQANTVHLVEILGKYRLFAIPADKKRPHDFNALILWSNTKDRYDSVDVLLRDLRENAFLQSLELDWEIPRWRSQLEAQAASEVKTVKCNRYAFPEGGAVLLGDAAHCTGATLGQGANSALMDVGYLIDSLSDPSLSLPGALSSYSNKAVPEGQALLQLVQLPPNNRQLGSFFQILYNSYQAILTILQRTGANVVVNSKTATYLFPLPVQSLLAQSSMSFSEVARRNKFWIRLSERHSSKVTVSNLTTFVSNNHDQGSTAEESASSD